MSSALGRLSAVRGLLVLDHPSIGGRCAALIDARYNIYLCAPPVTERKRERPLLNIDADAGHGQYDHSFGQSEVFDN